MTRLAYVCADGGVPVFGNKGSSVHVQEMVRALRAEGATVDIFATRFDGEAPEGLETVTVHALPALPRGDLRVRERAAMAGNVALLARLQETGPFDVVYERYSLWSHAGMEHAERSAIPGILEVNAPLIAEQSAHRGLHHVQEAEDAAARAFAAASALVAVSPGVAAYLQRQSAAQGRVHVIANGVDPERFYVVGRREPGDALTVGFVGTLKPWHGLDVLVDAFVIALEAVPSLRLLVVGDGPERASVEGRIAAAGIVENVTFTGAVPPAAIPALLARMDIAVAPYPDLADFYFSPLKLYEYMAAGLAVVASRVGTIPRDLRDGREGMLYPPGSTGGLADALLRLAADEPLRRRLGRAARAAVRRDHTWRGVARRTLAVAARAREPAVL
ncbi:glycosyltransferase family 4 protein [soil metagenome]